MGEASTGRSHSHGHHRCSSRRAQILFAIAATTALRRSLRLLSAALRPSGKGLRRLDPRPSKKTPVSMDPRLVVHQPDPSRVALWAAVVEMVSVVVEPLPETDAGLKLQVLSRGKPAHDPSEKVMVPLYPGWPVTVSIRFPLPPGLEIVIDGAAAVTPKSGCTLTAMEEEVGPM